MQIVQNYIMVMIVYNYLQLCFMDTTV